MFRKLLLTTVVISVALLGALPARADDGDSRGFFIESFTPPPTTGPEGPAQELVPGSDEYEIDLQLPSGLALRRSFSRGEIDRRDTIFDTAIREDARSAAEITLGDRTSMHFSRDERAVSDVLLNLLERETTTAMGFSQEFGSGATAGMFEAERSLHVEEKPDEDALRTLTHSLGLDTGLGEGTHLSAGFTQRESEEDASRLQETRYGAELTMALSGGEGRAQYDYLQRMAEGSSTRQQIVDISAPFQVPGGVLLAEHYQRDRLINDREQVDRDTKFIVPLSILHDGAEASYTQVAKIRGDSREQKSQFAFVTPLDLFGHAASFEHTSTETIDNAEVEDEHIYRLAADIGGSQAMIDRTDTFKAVGDDEPSHHRRWRLFSPELTLATDTTLHATHVRHERDGDELSAMSRMKLDFAHLDPLTVRATHTMHETPGERTRHDSDIRTLLRLAGNARLSGSIRERQLRDGSPEIVRHLEVQRDKASDGDVDVRFGYTSFGAQEEDTDSAMLAQVNVGEQSSVGLSATYSEYNERRMQPLPEPTTNVEMRAGDPSRLGLRAGFSDQAGRPEPERTLGLATSAFGGSLKLDYLRNALDPRGDQVMISDVYELGYRRTILGDVGLDLGYRYFVPREESALDPDHYFKLRLDGGRVRNGGKIALSYLSGHFVPYPRRGDPPASLLDLTYERRWRDDGRVFVTLSREEPPIGSSDDENYEAQIKYEMRF